MKALIRLGASVLMMCVLSCKWDTGRGKIITGPERATPTGIVLAGVLYAGDNTWYYWLHVNAVLHISQMSQADYAVNLHKPARPDSSTYRFYRRIGRRRDIFSRVTGIAIDETGKGFFMVVKSDPEALIKELPGCIQPGKPVKGATLINLL